MESKLWEERLLTQINSFLIMHMIRQSDKHSQIVI